LTLEKARRLLVCEISVVMRAPKSEAEEQIDQTLKARKIASVGGAHHSLTLSDFRQAV
jgi:hypothetical protein